MNKWRLQTDIFTRFSYDWSPTIKFFSIVLHYFMPIQITWTHHYQQLSLLCTSAE